MSKDLKGIISNVDLLIKDEADLLKSLQKLDYHHLTAICGTIHTKLLELREKLQKLVTKELYQ